jgi:hypothetical protein
MADEKLDFPAEAISRYHVTHVKQTDRPVGLVARPQAETV